MIRKLIPVLLAATLSACANTGAPRSSSPSSDTSSSAPAASSGTSSGSSYSPMASGPSGKTCDASALQSEIGKSHPRRAGRPALAQRSQTARMLRPGQLVTMEYNDTRLNLIVDGKDVMTAIRCG